MTQENLEDAIVEFKKVLGDDKVRDDDQTLMRYETNVGEVTGIEVPCVLFPDNRKDVEEIVRISNEFNVPIYPISGGKNWGLGSKLPDQSGGIVVHLTNMKRIELIDKELGIVYIEPGVTQRELYEFIQDNDLPFLFSPTGSGADSSMLGNVIDGGDDYHGSRRDSISGLEVVCGDGTVLRPGILFGSDKGHHVRDGIGPIRPELFFQTNYGVVTGAEMGLMPRAEKSVMYKASLPNDEDFVVMFDRFSKLRANGIITTAPHIANSHRTISAVGTLMYEYYTMKGIGSSHDQRTAMALEFAQTFSTPWSVVSGISGNKEYVDYAKNQIKEAMKGIGSVLFLDDKLLALGNFASKYFGFMPPIQKIESLIYAVGPVYDIISRGKPIDDSLKSVYWPLEAPPEDLEPDYSRAGLVYYLPVAQARGDIAQLVVSETEQIYRKYGFDAYITLNLFKGPVVAFRGVINNIFDRWDPEEVERAHRCNRELHQGLIDKGVMPYRVGIENMSLLINDEDPQWQKANAMKEIFDPNKIIAPGRYI